MSFKVCEKYYIEYQGFYKIFSFNYAQYNTISNQFEEIALASAACATPK